MKDSSEDLAVLRRGLDQVSSLLSEVGPDVLDRGTPCEDWRVRDLVDHVVAAPHRFARMMRGVPIDWSAPTPPAGDNPAARFRSHADDLLETWAQQQGSRRGPGLGWQCAELAVHTWDLAIALGRSTDGLDPEVAELGLAFMHANLTDDNRRPAFGPEQPAPAEADAYQHIAAIAGRRL